LLPMSMMVMLGFACCRASSSQDARWLNVSRLAAVRAVASSPGEARQRARRRSVRAAAAREAKAVRARALRGRAV
jgi:hypothetical protein